MFRDDTTAANDDDDEICLIFCILCEIFNNLIKILD